MKTIREIQEMKEIAKELRSQGNVIGFVPTMGYFHKGHLSLVRQSIEQCDRTIVSIFVNPTQFGPHEDFKRYPRNNDRDSLLLEKEGVDYVFIPESDELYPSGYKTYVGVHDLDKKLCGKSRPTHFRGVCTIVLKLLNIISPDIAFFGQKDAQQAIILKKMIKDLDFDVEIIITPIIRDKNGLALSSRSEYLNKEERKAAQVLYLSLQKVKDKIIKGEKRATVIIGEIEKIIKREPLIRIDYVKIVDLIELDPLDEIKGEALIALAVFVGKTRLIDNMIIRMRENDVII